MTHIEQMIKDLCPHGVEWKTFDELGVFYGGLSGKSKDDFKDGNAKFITYLNIANNPALRLDIQDTVQVGPNEKQNVVLYGDALFTGSSETPDECAMSSVVTEYPTEKLYLNSFCFGFRFNSLEGIEPAFFKHYFRSNHFRQAVRRTANGTTRFNVSKKEFAKLEIPIPPLEIQERIVECLDAFSALAAELQAELQKRRTQYEYYRTRLLTPPPTESNSADNNDGCNWQWMTLGKIAKYRRGSFPQPYGNAEWYDGEGAMPFVQVADVEELGMRLKPTTKQFISKLAMPKSVFVPEGTVIVTLQGSIGKVAITQYDSYVDRTLGIFESYQIDINKRYFAYQLERIFAIKREKARGGTIKTITKEEFTDFAIPVPSLAEQERIVSILDKFDALTTSLTDGLPAEQIAQQKRYEYYRDKLLTFPKP